jgi:hypothetical protein
VLLDRASWRKITRAQSIAARSIQRAWVIASLFSIVRTVAL